MIREYERPGGTTYFHFLHVATAASGFCNRAGLHIAMLASDRIRGLAGVAGEAFAVVTGVISHQRLVRVMTSDAAESPIASVEAPVTTLHRSPFAPGLHRGLSIVKLTALVRCGLEERRV